jgi:YD repeat-containing protein
LGPDGKPTGLKNPMVAPDGTYIVQDANGGQVSVSTDGSSENQKTDGSIVKSNADGKVSEIDYANGSKRTFGYDEHGRLNSVTDPDGKVYNLKPGSDPLHVGLGTLEAADGSKKSAVIVKADGNIEYIDGSGKVHNDYTSGNSTTTSKTAAEISQTAESLHDGDGLFSNGENLRKTLAGMDPADRIALDQAYQLRYGESLTDHLKSDTKNPFKHDNANEALALMSDAHLRDAALQKFSDPADLQHAMKDIDDFRKRAQDQGVPAGELAAAEEKAAKELQTNRKFPSDELKELEKNLGATAPSIESLEEKYGVKYEEVKGPDGQTTRHYYVEGEGGTKLPVLDSNSDNPLEVERQLHEWRANKEREIEQKYNVQFAHDGDRDNPLGKEVELRDPRIDELLALEKGFEHSQPSTSTTNGRPVLVQFAVTPSSPYDAYVLGKADGQQRILFEPLNRDFRGLEDTIIHEWTHNAEHNNDERNPDVTRQFYEAQGYRNVKFKGPDGNDVEQWQMRDKDGNYWTQGPGQSPFGNWTRVDENGKPLKADGTPASGWDDRQAAKRDNDQMAEAAAVTPASSYHPNPVENGAEAERFFRGDEKSRGDLFRASPELYAAAKKFDQDDLDNDPAYGKNADGTSKYIRLPNGTVGLNNEQNQKAVAEYEANLQNPPPAPPHEKPGMHQDTPTDSNGENKHR